MDSETDMPFLFALLLALLLVAGCGEAPPASRTYQEVILRPAPAPADMDASMTPSPTGTIASSRPEVAWTAPSGWTETPGDSMRLTTFRVGDGECSITAFPGDVGGMEANVRRWLGQMKVEDPSPEAMREILAGGEPIVSAGGFQGRVFDLARLAAAADPGATAILAGVFSVDGASVFVKLAGPVSLLSEERERFGELCRSLE